MPKTALEKAFDQFLYERSEEIILTVLPKNPGYNKAHTDFYLAFESLRTATKETPELFRLMLALEIAAGAMAMYRSEVAYKEGLRDGQLIQQEFASLITGRAESSTVEVTQ